MTPDLTPESRPPSPPQPSRTVLTRRPPRVLAVAATLALFALGSLPVLAEPATRDIGERPLRSAFYLEGQWMAKEGGLLPFATDEQAIEFLETADVVATKEIEGSINHPLRLTLEKDGVTARAIFRTVDVERDAMVYVQEHAHGFRDNYVYEVAAYELSRLLGLDNVPPTTLRTIDGKEGSIQLWIENAMGVGDRMKQGIDKKYQQLWMFQKQNMAVFDNLIYNFDRNPGNMLIDVRGKAWFVDHTRTFKILPVLNGRDDIKVVERQLWENLQNLDPKLVHERLGPYLRETEIDALLARRDKLVKLIKRRIARNGEDAIIFELHRS